MLFQEATPEGVFSLLGMLNAYETVSGQKVSLYKSSVFFYKHVPDKISEELAAVFGMKVSEGKGKYLGLPYLIGKNRKEILIKFVLQAMPSNMLSVCLIPRTLCEELICMIKQFWWSSGDKE